MTEKFYKLTEDGQLVVVQQTESLVLNPDLILQALKESVNTPTPAALPTIKGVDSYHILGDGMCAFERIVGNFRHTYGGILLEQIPFNTKWELTQSETVNRGKPFLIPSMTESEEPCDVILGVPLMLPIPSDLVIHFFVEWVTPKNDSLIQPKESSLFQIPALLVTKRNNCYLTCFSRNRNTCVMLPFPNLYEDCRLCTGDAFTEPSFSLSRNHWGITTSIRSHVKSWMETTWNRDLLHGPETTKARQYKKWLRFDAATGEHIKPDAPLEGNWTSASSPLPLSSIYAPWIDNREAVDSVRDPEPEKENKELIEKLKKTMNSEEEARPEEIPPF